MTIEQEFAKLRDSSREETLKVVPRLLEKAGELPEVIEREGVLIEYVQDLDHLYITLGSSREGMAFFAGPLVILVDPNTLDLVSFEIFGFTKAVKTESFSKLDRLLSFLKWQPVVHIPPSVHDERANFPRAMAEGVHRELAAAAA